MLPTEVPPNFFTIIAITSLFFAIAATCQEFSYPLDGIQSISWFHPEIQFTNFQPASRRVPVQAAGSWGVVSALYLRRKKPASHDGKPDLISKGLGKGLFG
jgi:hypothetical protein